MTVAQLPAPTPQVGEDLREQIERLTMLANACGLKSMDHLPVVSRANAAAFGTDLRAVLALVSQDNWRSMKTAPRDGTEVLLLVDGVVHQGDWQGPSDGAVYAKRPCQYNWSSRTAGSSLFDDDVTAWMPLPAPPSSRTEA